MNTNWGNFMPRRGCMIQPRVKPWAEWREDKQNLQRSIAPEGLQDSAQGFNPGNHSIERFRPEGARGYRMNLALQHCSKRRWWISIARRSERAIETFHNCTLLPCGWYVRSCAHSGRVSLGGGFPGLKPWAESSRPFGTKNYPKQPLS